MTYVAAALMSISQLIRLIAISNRNNNCDCQHCKSKGEANKANTVHHIKHLKQHPELALDEENLMAVCKECHNELHPEKHYSFMRHKSYKKKYLNEERW